MKALTIWQPWASLILAGAKTWEWRRWSAPRWIVGQRIVIHAAARRVTLGDVQNIFEAIDAGESSLDSAIALPLLERWYKAAKADETDILPLGCGLGSAILGVPRRATEIFPDDQRADPAMWGWPLSDIEGWAPVRPCRGLQSFWDWPQELGA